MEAEINSEIVKVAQISRPQIPSQIYKASLLTEKQPNNEKPYLNKQKEDPQISKLRSIISELNAKECFDFRNLEPIQQKFEKTWLTKTETELK
jgi:hypothetical protein